MMRWAKNLWFNLKWEIKDRLGLIPPPVPPRKETVVLVDGPYAGHEMEINEGSKHIVFPVMRESVVRAGLLGSSESQEPMFDQLKYTAEMRRFSCVKARTE